MDRRPYAFLQSRNMRQSQDLLNIAEKEIYNDAVIKHLSTQRDELLAHYIRGQKLALSICHDNHRKGKGKYFSRWKGLLKDAGKKEAKAEVMQQVQVLTKIKEKSRAI